jgi:uncharacterized protein (TIGR02284 family)
MYFIRKQCVKIRNCSVSILPGASLVKDPAIARRFRVVAQARERFAGELEAIMPEKGRLPRDVDPEKEALESLWLRLKASLAGKDRAVVAKEAEKVESELKARARNALKEKPPEAAAEMLMALENDISRTLERLRRNGQ